MKELGLFVDSNNHKYIGYFNPYLKEVEIMGPLGDAGKSTLGQVFTEKAESEAKAIEIITRTLKNTKHA